jgi:CheY-like chemotaxis protein
MLKINLDLIRMVLEKGGHTTQAAMDDYLTKPLEPGEVFATLARMNG